MSDRGTLLAPRDCCALSTHSPYGALEPNSEDEQPAPAPTEPKVHSYEHKEVKSKMSSFKVRRTKTQDIHSQKRSEAGDRKQLSQLWELIFKN